MKYGLGKFAIKQKHNASAVLDFPKAKFDKLAVLEFRRKDLAFGANTVFFNPKTNKHKHVGWVLDEDKDNFYLVLKERK